VIRVAIDVEDGNGRFSLLICAENLQQAVRFAAIRYPDHAVRVRFPLDPETFFVDGSVAVEAIKVESRST
jgi:hypothetical protein